MNNAKMWLVVKPTVGIPLFLGAVAVGSFSVHVAVLTNTTWVSDFLSGQPLGSGAARADLAAPNQLPVPASHVVEGDQVVLITLPDGTVAHAVLTAPPAAQAVASLK